MLARSYSIALWIAVAAQASTAAAATTSPARAASAEPTFVGQVAPLLRTHCLMCHRAGSSEGALPLATYEQASAHAEQVLRAVESGAMPPWPIDALHSAPMRDDPRLSATEIDVLRAWLSAGLPRGTRREAAPEPPPVGWAGTQHPPPDDIISLPTFSIPAQGELPYQQILIKVNFKEDRWIAALQVLPGNPAVVHHMGIAELRLPAGVGPQQIRDLAHVAAKLGLPPDALIQAQPAIIDTLSGGYDMLAAYTPGEAYESLPSGTGKLLKAGENNYVNFNIHYTTIGQATSDQSRLALWYSRTPPKRQVYRTPSAGRTILAEGHELYPDDPGSKAEGTDVAIPPIPPYASDYELVGITGYERPVTLYSFQPHAHLRAKDFRYDLIYPDGRTRTLLSIPKYEYHRQLDYYFATAVEAPAGSKLVVTAHYDNSPANQHLREFSSINPTARCGPDKYAFFRPQNQTWDEMFSPIVQFAIDDVQATDESAHLPLVAVRGCLVSDGSLDASHGWELVHASRPQRALTQTITRAELPDTTRTRGTQRYSLIGLEPFRPAALKGARVLVKGVKIPQGDSARINVTALQELGGECDK
ncbi:MAG TPA: hypothetical protein VME21_04995 [Steroidobacteraceae bacterium]|nr:hypothetical protein [Steroidobacteraceae bacterium]